MIYPVVDIFTSFQGEGHMVGALEAFVRLAGCSVTECHIRKQCDEAPWRATMRLRACDIVDTLRSRGPFCAVSITGGEPTDHDLVPLICALREAGYAVRLETSGVRSVAGYPLDWLTVSPKTPDYVQRIGNVLKIVVDPSWREPWAVIKGLADGTTFFHYYLQPLYAADGTSNREHVMDLLRQEHNGRGKWMLSDQAHKTWGVR